ncbi:MAG TPA: carboxypeptidase-like regulatory domain-containing protein [Fibrobacteria bacterium]|jgi:hypothetical protein|nr:carboxypeptidase-like regulatory domain-containing protein [Fibrobacteria bacterium]
MSHPVSPRFRAIILVLLCGFLSAWGAAVHLTGVVVDTAGVPVAGAAVALEKLGLTATSGADGTFLLGSAVGILRNTLPSGMPFSRLGADGRLQVSMREEGTLAVTVHGSNGSVLASFSRRLSAGMHRVALPTTGSGVRFYRVKTEGREEVLRALEMPGVARGSLSEPSSANNGMPLSKAAASSPLYDAISASKAGYLKSYVSIVTEDSSGIQVKLLPAAFPKFSFFVTSMKAMLELSGSPNGFGGDLRFGETGQGAGLRGADKLCGTIAERSLKNAKYKGWRAFLSASVDSYGAQANAIDRIGSGPWYDRLGRRVGKTKTDLVGKAGRPDSAEATIKVDLPNEDGVPNSHPAGSVGDPDNHRTMTGSDAQGKLYQPNANYTCSSWTSSDSTLNAKPRMGWSWVETGNVQWISGLNESGCGAGINLVQGTQTGTLPRVVGSGGGYGGIYCFALDP